MNEQPVGDELARQLRSDAVRWQPMPSAGCLARLDAALRELPVLEPRRGRVAGIGLAAAVLVSVLVGWAVMRPTSPQPQPRSRQAVWLDRALAPLEGELAAMNADARSLAGSLWLGVPGPLRRLFDEAGEASGAGRR